MDLRLVAQAASLLCTFFASLVRVAACLPVVLATIAWHGVVGHRQGAGRAVFYAGTVMHSRKRPKEHSFTYPVRMAVIDLDSPPEWWRRGPKDSMSASEARKLASTAGPVRLLTHPAAAGYLQNPISVYYCYSADGSRLERCIAEVTNTPWGERVTFLFRPGRGGGEAVPKALHVSPLMDMENTWILKATEPKEELFLSVAASHPQHGDYFVATLTATADAASPALPNEVASLATLLRYGFQPQRVAFWIYWQAVLLLWKGVPFHPPVGPAFHAVAEGRAKQGQPRMPGGRAFVWRAAQRWPWAAVGAAG